MSEQALLPLAPPEIDHPCTMCQGTEIEIDDNGHDDYAATRYIAVCSACGWKAYEKPSRDEAIVAWNDLMVSLDLPF